MTQPQQFPQQPNNWIPTAQSQGNDWFRRAIIALAVACALALAGRFLLGIPALGIVAGWMLVVLLGLGIYGVVRAAKRGSNRNWQLNTGFTADGQPIYPVIGYTPDGQPVTSDRALGYQSGRTNSLAIVALVLGLVFPVAAIPVGHVAISQIRRTGEQGNGLAIAGLVLGYVGVVATIVMVAVIASQGGF